MVILSSDWNGRLTVNQLPLSSPPISCCNGVIYPLDAGVLMPKFLNKTSQAKSKIASRIKGPKSEITDALVVKIGVMQKPFRLVELLLRLRSRKAGSVIDGRHKANTRLF